MTSRGTCSVFCQLDSKFLMLLDVSLLILLMYKILDCNNKKKKKKRNSYKSTKEKRNVYYEALINVSLSYIKIKIYIHLPHAHKPTKKNETFITKR